MTYKQALKYIHTKQRFGSVPGLFAVSLLLKYLDNPQQHLKFIHIAGTNGKGSVTTMISNMLQNSGYKVGTYISPFVVDFRERFQINAKMIGKGVFCSLLSRVKAACISAVTETGCNVTEFELLTALALLWFYEQRCDIVCLEVGLGGRLDATNVVENVICAVIMSIGFDHTEILGDTLEKIAAEKAGIIKNGCKVICYPMQEQTVINVIEGCSKKNNAALTIPDKNLISITKNNLLGNNFTYKNEDYFVCLAGKHQVYNSVCAIETAYAIREYGFNIRKKTIKKTLSLVRFAARIEVLQDKPLVILDGAHNADGIRALVSTLKASDIYNITAVFGVLSDKPVFEMLSLLAPHIDFLYAVAPDSPRALCSATLCKIAESIGIKAQDCHSVDFAVKSALKHKSSGVLIAGSLYLANEARKMF